MSKHSDTRWWSKWDILQQALYYFGDIEPFLRENEELSPAVRRHLLEIFDDHQDFQDLQDSHDKIQQCKEAVNFKVRR